MKFYEVKAIIPRWLVWLIAPFCRWISYIDADFDNSVRQMIDDGKIDEAELAIKGYRATLKNHREADTFLVELETHIWFERI